jgi:hypothetical protein
MMKALSSPGGKISVLVFLVIGGLLADHFGVTYAKDVVIPSLSILLSVLGPRPAGRNR